MRNFIHRHLNIKANYLETLSNGSLKVIMTDNTAPSPKLRRPKQSTITKSDRNQWLEVTAEGNKIDLK